MSEVPLYPRGGPIHTSLSQCGRIHSFKAAPRQMTFIDLQASLIRDCRSTSLSRKRTPLGPYRRPMPRVRVVGFFLRNATPPQGFHTALSIVAR